MKTLNRLFKLPVQPERIGTEAAILADALMAPGVTAGRIIREPRARINREQAIDELFGMVSYWSRGWL